MKPRVAFATCEEVPNLSGDDGVAARELAALGVETVPAVWSAPHDWAAFDAVVIRSTWHYWLRYAEFLRWLDVLEASAARVWNPVAVLRDNVDKRYLKRLAEAGLPVVPTAWLEPGDSRSLASLMDQNGWSVAVVKPVVSGNAFLTHKLDRAQALSAPPRLEEAWKLGPVMVQPFLPSVASEGEYSLIFFDRKFSHAVLKKAAPQDFRVQAEHGGTTRAASIPADWIALGEKILKSVGGPLLYARVDIALHESRPLLMELELTEPYLYMEHAPGSAARFARAVLNKAGKP